MSLGLYLDTTSDSLITSKNKFSITFDGRIGGTQDKIIYIRNDDITRWYDDITLEAYDSSASNIVNNGRWSWKLKESDIVPTNEEWANISSGNTVTLSVDVGSSTYADIVSYIPVWIRVEVPNKQYVQTIETVNFILRAQEHSIE